MGPTSTQSLDQAPSSREAILRKLRERIVGYAASNMQRDAAEDLAQEVLILLHEKYGNLERLEDLLPLSLKIVRFKMMAHRRKARRHGEHTQVSVDEIQTPDGRADPFSEFFMAKLSPKGKAFEEFIRALFQRSLLSVHTLNPTVDHMEDWLENLFRTVQPAFVGVDRWVRVFNEADPKKIEAYEVRTAFYRPDDPAIRAARALQRGEQVDAATRQAVFADGTHTCYYGHILQTGLEYTRKASQFWRGETSHLVAPNFDEWPLS